MSKKSFFLFTCLGVIVLLISLVSISPLKVVAQTTNTSVSSTEVPVQYISLFRQLILLLQTLLAQQNQVAAPGLFPPLTGPFSLGQSHAQVLQLQKMLIRDGTYLASTTGRYDQTTVLAVQRFQSKYKILSSGLPTTNGFGLAGPMTRAKLNQLYATQRSTGSGGSSTITTSVSRTTTQTPARTTVSSSVAPRQGGGSTGGSGGGGGGGAPISSGTVAPSSYQISASSGAGGTVSPGTVSVAQGASQTFIITPDTGYQIDTITVDGQVLAPVISSYTFSNVVAAHSLNVTFTVQVPLALPQPPYSLTLASNPLSAGSITKLPNLSGYSKDSTVSLTAVPATGYLFQSWSGDASGTQNPTTLTMSTHKEVTANFAPLVTGTGTPPPVLVPTPAPSPSTPNGVTTCTSITNLTITWTFDKAYPCGQFVTGSSWWVVGPVTVTSVSPEWNGSTNGSMVDPVATGSGSWQGYDNRKGGYLDSLRVRFPLTLTPSGKAISLVSTIGLATPATGGAAEVLDKAAVLTVLSSAPSANAFRPPYVAGSKPIYTTDQINYSLLPNLAIPAGTAVPDYVGTNKIFHVWLDHGPKVDGARIHPRTNMPPYPRDSAQQVSVAALLALSNSSQKTVMTNRLVQLGIDSYAVSLTNGDAFRAYGGFGSGRKWPILFAGIMLNDAGMKNPAKKISSGSGIDKFGEDGHTYYGTPTVDYPNGKPLWGRDCGSNPQYYGNHDCRDPEGVLNVAALPNGGSYEACCTSKTWVGEVLAASLMGAKDLWNHPALFDYMDRWIATPSMWSYSGTIYGYGDSFVEAMWKRYRPTLGSVTPAPAPTPVTTYTLSTSASNGTVSKSPDQSTYTSGTSVTLTATPNAGYQFSHWSGDVTGSVNPNLLTINSNKAVTANFTSITVEPPPSVGTDVTDGLVARWSFDQATISGSTAQDISGNGNSATLSNTTVATGKVGEGLSFNGSSSYVNAGSPSLLDDLHNKGGMSISAWINPQRISSGIIVAKSCLPGEGACWAFYLSDTGKLSFFKHTTGSSLTKVASTQLVADQWQHVAVTWTGVSGPSNIKLYINGVETVYSSSSGSGTLSSDSSWSLYIGRTHTGKFFFSGLMDDVRVYGRALSAGELQQMYSATSARRSMISNLANVISAVSGFLQRVSELLK